MGGSSTASGSSPHTRGALSLARQPRVWGGIIPAYAGSTACPSTPSISRGDHPRIRGEHSMENVEACKVTGSSPHTRGAHLDAAVALLAALIIPAYAGSTPRSCPSCGARRDHPRIRGEHSGGSGSGSTWAGSSPHTRGAPDGAPAVRDGMGIIPAYAGSTLHPCKALRLARGSSPHTRGALLPIVVAVSHAGIIPAYAGSTRARRPRPRT